MRDSVPELRAAAEARLGLHLDPEQAGKLVELAKLAHSWSQRMNLVSAVSVGEILTRHVLDSLAAARFLVGVSSYADVGSGAGFPGLPLAVVCPGKAWLIEARRRRVTFLRHAVRMLQLENVDIFEERAERFQGPELDAVVGRGLPRGVLESFAARVLASRGRLIVMRKLSREKTRVEGFEEIDIFDYSLPGDLRHQVALLHRCFT